MVIRATPQIGLIRVVNALIGARHTLNIGSSPEGPPIFGTLYSRLHRVNWILLVEVSGIQSRRPSSGCLLQLFQHEGPPVASASTLPTYAPPPANSDFSSGGGGGSGMGNAPLNTLDEPIWETVKRDLHRIGGNLILVVFPFKNRDQQSAALRNWDLWGPMVRASLRLAAINAVILPCGLRVLRISQRDIL